MTDHHLTDPDAFGTPEEASTGVKPESAPSTRTSREDRSRPGAFASRFAILNIVLALVAGASLGALLVLGLKDDAPTAGSGIIDSWGEFVPRGSSNTKANEIAQRVGRTYRNAAGGQIVGVIAGPPTYTVTQPEGSVQVLVRAIAARPALPTGGSSNDRDVEVIDTSNSLQYMLCGYGRSCSIATGIPSEERALLLRREALELGMYTFKYMPNIDSIVVFLPPPFRNGQQAAPGQAVYLRRGDLSGVISRPLRDTLDATTPRVGTMTERDIQIVNELTVPQRFTYDYTQAQDGGLVMLLDPITQKP